ncbi:MAG: hypothetical protein JO046_21755 [Solirubrobacterales bacterium]|nr:hypothetical protein [Solirubrobacterales bacterium]
MPVELTADTLRDALAVAGEWDEEGARSARAALEWMGWEGDGPLLLRRYDVQLFVWYTLPRKFLTTLEHKREAADALARTLERIGGRAAVYAQTCRARETDELLCAWENEDPGAWPRFRELLEESGLEPPDTKLLAWGPVMGFVEACAREQVATALEQAVETGGLTPGRRGFRHLQAKVADAALREPLDGGDGGSRLDAIHAERLENWLERGMTRGSPERRSILQPIIGLLVDPPSALDPDAARVALAPALWLLELGMDGIALTQTGALNRALVRDAAERWEGWWNAEIHGPAHRETDVSLLYELHHQLRGMRLLRRAGRRLLITARGRALLADPSRLLLAIANNLLAGDDFRAACAELVVPLLLTGFEGDWAEPFAKKVCPAIAAEGWQSNGESPSVRDVSWAIADFIRRGTASGLIETQADWPFHREPLVLTHAGRPALIAALRDRALAPRTGPY